MFATDLPFGDIRHAPGASADQIAAGIEKFGIQVIVVSDTSDGEYRPYVYTVGFRDRGLPELIAFADDEQQLDEMGAIFYRLARRKLALTAGDCLQLHGESLFVATPYSEFDDFLQERCLIEARAYYGVDHLDLLVVVKEHELHDPAGLH